MNNAIIQCSDTIRCKQCTQRTTKPQFYNTEKPQHNIVTHLHCIFSQYFNVIIYYLLANVLL